LLIPSNSALAVKSFASEYKIPIISGGGADTLGVPADPWLFKVSPANRDYMVAVSEYMKKKGYKRLATLYSTDAYGLKGFLGAILGGFRSATAAVLGGLGIGLLESLGAGYISSGWKDFIVYGVLLADLLVRGGVFLAGRVAPASAGH
jgi:hypothetical protein